MSASPHHHLTFVKAARQPRPPPAPRSPGEIVAMTQLNLPPEVPSTFFFFFCGKELKMLAVVNMQMSSLNRTHALFFFVLFFLLSLLATHAACY